MSRDKSRDTVDTLVTDWDCSRCGVVIPAWQQVYLMRDGRVYLPRCLDCKDNAGAYPDP